ncbi:putative holin-like toxin [Anaerobacillus alkaliphilus]|nr:putative holin-like toxin [Anaerobacillus alkaliphilus]
MTTFEAFSLIAQFGLLLITAFTFIITIVVYVTKKK